MTFLCTSTYYNPTTGETTASGILYREIKYKKENGAVGAFFPSAVLDGSNPDVTIGTEVDVDETAYRDYAKRIVCREK